jgi:D-3-phosphoglycerate dehydrogenase
MSPHSKVYVTDIGWPSLAAELEVLDPLGAVLEIAPDCTDNQMAEYVRDADAIMTCWRTIPPEVVSSAEQCRVIARYGIGLDNIPVALATELGIVVANVPDFCLDELTDQVMAGILALSRQLPALDTSVKRGEWSRDTSVPLRQLRGQTLGLLGFGNTARHLVPKAQAFGLKVLAYTPRLAAAALPDGAALAKSFQDLLERSDWLSIHAPLTPETAGLFDDRAFTAMKDSAVLINTSRGAIIDEPALNRALTSGSIAGAVLDVLTTEPPTSDIPWRNHPNVLMTPHSAFLSEESLRTLATRTAQNVATVLMGQVPDSVVNPEVLGRDNCRIQA